jgi:hypothetical protein
MHSPLRLTANDEEEDSLQSETFLGKEAEFLPNCRKKEGIHEKSPENQNKSK